MGDKDLPVTINRAPVLTLWAAVVVERLGFERDEALTLGRALAGLAAHAKGVRLGIFEPSAPEEVRERRGRLAEGERLEVHLMGRTIPVVRTPEGLRALDKDQPAQAGERGAVSRGQVRRPAGRGPGRDGAAGRLAAGGRAGPAGVPALRAVPTGG